MGSKTKQGIVLAITMQILREIKKLLRAGDPNVDLDDSTR